MNLTLLRKAKAKLKKILKSLQPVHRPHFMIIDTQKAGTSSLHFYLDQYPQIFESNVHVLGFNNLVKDTENTLKKATDFLGVEDLGWPFLNTEPRNTRNYSERLPGVTNSFLKISTVNQTRNSLMRSNISTGNADL